MLCIYVAFVLEDSLEGKSIAMTAIAVYALAASFSSWARDGTGRTRFESVCLKPLIEMLASRLSFVVQVYRPNLAAKQRWTVG